MRSIKFRFTILLLFTICNLVLATHYYYKQKNLLTKKNFETEKHLDILRITSKLQASNFDQKLFNELQDLREKVTEKERELSLSDVLQAYSSENTKLLEKRKSNFEKIETIFFEQSEVKYQQLSNAIEFAFGTTIVLCVFSTLLLLIVGYSAIFSPLRNVTDRMRDFLSGRYQYKFLPKAKNEMGELQYTFNSVAQKVTHNMEELQALDSAKSDFLNIASHELRTPMTSIKGSLGLITSGVMGQLEPNVLNLCQIAEAETDRLIRMTNDFLDLAKIEAGRLPLQKQWIRLSVIIEKAKQGLMGLEDAFQVKIEILDIAEVEVHVDPDRVQQIITNLLSNAIKFSPTNDVVQIRAFCNQSVFVEISDHGKGIAKEDQDYIFQKFRQATSPQNPLVKGTGLGLAICKALTESHGGEIGVRSRPGDGSTFYFTLPEWQATSSKVIDYEQKRIAA